MCWFAAQENIYDYYSIIVIIYYIITVVLLNIYVIFIGKQVHLLFKKLYWGELLVEKYWGIIVISVNFDTSQSLLDNSFKIL